MDEMMNCYDPSDYNSLGPFMFRDIFFENRDKWESENIMFNAPPHYFYPIPESRMIGSAYKGQMHFTQESFALHWYGGHPKSQEYNKQFTEESAFSSEDTISTLSRPLLDYWYRR
jgi:hypothetical protein